MIDQGMLKKLRDLALAATPGPWDTKRGPDGYQHIGPARSILRIALVDGVEPCDALASREADAAFIAAADPQTVIALLDEIERLRVIPAADIASLARQLWEEERGELTRQLASMTAARDELADLAERNCPCSLAERYSGHHVDCEAPRIVELRKVGQ